MSTTTVKAVYTSSYRSKDKYGRSVTSFTVSGKTVAVVVCLPKTSDHRYLVNDWASEAQGDVTYYGKRKDAVSQAESIVTREVAKV